MNSVDEVSVPLDLDYMKQLTLRRRVDRDATSTITVKHV